MIGGRGKDIVLVIEFLILISSSLMLGLCLFSRFGVFMWTRF